MLQTSHGHVLFFGLHVTKDVVWRGPEGDEARRISIYLQNSVELDGIDASKPRQKVADLCGDGKSVLVVMESGTMLAFSWTAKVSSRNSIQIMSSFIIRLVKNKSNGGLK